MTAPGPEDDDPRAFRSMLQELRADGCTVLVTGDVNVDLTADVTPAFFGSPAERRRRILALVGHEPTHGTVDRLLPADVSPYAESVSVVEHRPGVRSAAVVPTGARPESGTPERVDAESDGSLDGLTTTLTRVVADEETGPGSLEPACLRLCVVHLADLLAEYETEAVARFCRIVGAQVRGLSGMAYFHLGTPPGHHAVSRLAPAVDARIDLARRDGAPVQRWHVHEYDYETGWFPLSPPE